MTVGRNVEARWLKPPWQSRSRRPAGALSPPRALAQDSSQLRSYPAFKRRLSCSSASCTAACDEVCIAGALGSTLALADSSGALDTTYSYEPFGNTTISVSSGNPYQFTGRENDDTGLYYYRARYYSPTFQRFVSQDPIGFGGGDINIYAYVQNQPTILTDPRGKQDVVPVPPAGGTDISPYTDIDPFGPEEGPTCSADWKPTLNDCLNAAENDFLWERFCRALPNKQLKQACWKVAKKNPQERRNVCMDFWEI